MHVRGRPADRIMNIKQEDAASKPLCQHPRDGGSVGGSHFKIHPLVTSQGGTSDPDVWWVLKTDCLWTGEDRQGGDVWSRCYMSQLSQVQPAISQVNRLWNSPSRLNAEMGALWGWYDHGADLIPGVFHCVVLCGEKSGRPMWSYTPLPLHGRGSVYTLIFCIYCMLLNVIFCCMISNGWKVKGAKTLNVDLAHTLIPELSRSTKGLVQLTISWRSLTICFFWREEEVLSGLYLTCGSVRLKAPSFPSQSIFLCLQSFGKACYFFSGTTKLDDITFRRHAPHMSQSRS